MVSLGGLVPVVLGIRLTPFPGIEYDFRFETRALSAWVIKDPVLRDLDDGWLDYGPCIAPATWELGRGRGLKNSYCFKRSSECSSDSIWHVS